ncbi:MAG: hypothetical protein R6V44_03490, partial [Paracoccaceae bacterium]
MPAPASASRRRPRRAAGRLLRAAAASALLAGCAQQGLGVADSGGEGAPLVLDAGGRSLAVTPPEGFCIDGEAVRPEARAAFVLIEDCALIGDAAGVFDGNAAADLPIPRPAVINGLVTLSVGDGPLFEAPGERETAFAGLEAFLRSDDGRATAGMGGGSEDIRILETRRTPDTLYVLVEDRGERVLPVLGDRFWRGFTEVKDRAVIASLGVFDASTLRDEQKLGHLARVVAALRDGNGDPVTPEERRLAEEAPAPRSAAARGVASASPAPRRPAAVASEAPAVAAIAAETIPTSRPGAATNLGRAPST